MINYLLLTSILATAQSWNLTSTHTTIIPQLTEDVTLNCSYEGPIDDDCHGVGEITRIQLLKMDDKNGWNKYVEIVLSNTSLIEVTGPKEPGLLAFGHLGKLNESFLSVTWSTSSEKTAGSYKCGVDCFVPDNRNDVHVMTGIVNLTRKDVTTKDLLDLVVQVRNKSNQLSQEMRSLKAESSAQYQKLTTEMDSLPIDCSEVVYQEIGSLKTVVTIDMDSLARNWSKIMSQEISSLKAKLTSDMNSLARNWSQHVSQKISFLKEELTTDMNSLARIGSKIMPQEISSLKAELTTDMDSQARNRSKIMSQEVSSLKAELTSDIGSLARNMSKHVSQEISFLKEELTTDMTSLARNGSKIMSQEISSLRDELTTDMDSQARNWSKIMSQEISSLRDELTTDIDSQDRNWSKIMSQEISSLGEEFATDMHSQARNQSKIMSQEISSLKAELAAEMDSQAKNWSKIMSQEISSFKEELTTDVNSETRNWSKNLSQEMNSLKEYFTTDVNCEGRNWSKIISQKIISLKNELSSDVKSRARNWSTIMSQEISSLKKDNLAKHQKLNADMKSQAINWSKTISQEINSLKEETLAQHQNLATDIKSQVHSDIVQNYFELRHWPAGSYSLLSTNDGCPETFRSKFKSDFSQFPTTTSYRPRHNFKSARNLNGDVFVRRGSRNLLKFDFCVSEIKEPRALWPTGTYCISYKSDDCPVGFEYGYIYVYLKTYRSITGINAHDATYYDDDYIGFNYCCRRDGHHNMPILLPNTRPFYLYRYGGICQKVRGLEVQEQTFTLEEDNSKQSYVGHEFSPDSTLNNFALHLCYYYKKQDSAF